ncbi:MAG TPA: o-succinylbenzoate synthase [Kineosporiaceae bacterium]|nr:o-succinylbenzoate synthase [Kineosporiaceae bacterium]
MREREGLAVLERLGVDVGGLRVYALPMVERFRGITVREGVLLRGPAGWGEFCPFDDYGDRIAADWLATALEAAVTGWPEPVRDRVPVNTTVPVVDPARAHQLVTASGCATAKVKVADAPGTLDADLARVAAVREALGPSGAIRVDANAAWDVESAVAAITALDAAAGGLQYVEQPCRTVPELAEVRRRVGVPIAADESIRRAEDPLTVAVAGAADVAVIKCTPLGGVRRSLAVAAAAGLACVVSSALESSVGLAAQLALAGALPGLDLACGLGTGALMTGDVVAGADRLLPVDGCLPVPRRAPEPDPDRCRAHAADPQRQAWWLDRLSRAALLLDTTRPGPPRPGR